MYLPFFSSDQVLRSLQTGSRPEISEFLYERSSFQDGVFGDHHFSGEGRRLDGLYGFGICSLSLYQICSTRNSFSISLFVIRLCSTPRIFAKVLLVAILRFKGLKLFHYFIDILLLPPLNIHLLEHITLTCNMLKCFGWIIRRVSYNKLRS